MALRLRLVWPALLALAVGAAFAGLRLARAGGDVEALAEIGTRFSEGDPSGTEGYDGQFVLYMAKDLDPESVAARLDRPAYRYQRILLPLLAKMAAFGDPDRVAWALLGLGLIAHCLGTFAVAAILDHHGRPVGYAVTYGLWVGLIVGVGVFLHEPLAYALAAMGWALRLRGRAVAGSFVLGLALFAKETTLVFWLAALLEDVLRGRERRGSTWAIACGGAVFVLWQVWLWRMFGEPGLGSGGAQGTPFEWIPFAGLARVGSVDVRVLAVYLIIFGPTILLPAIWGLVTGVRSLLTRLTDGGGWALLLNGGLIAFLPFSSFREPLALVRLATGLVLATLLFAAGQGRRRVLNYSLFWCALLALLANG
jgi:hypothetical protein